MREARGLVGHKNHYSVISVFKSMSFLLLKSMSFQNAGNVSPRVHATSSY